jgi:hypothetical protein
MWLSDGILFCAQRHHTSPISPSAVTTHSWTMKRRTQNATRVIYCFLRKSDSKYVFCDLLRLNTSSHPLHKTPNNTTPPHAPTSSQRMCTTSLCVPGSPYANWSQSPNLLNSAKLHKVFQNFVVPWKIDIKI